MCFPLNFAKFLRAPFAQNTSGRLLLSLQVRVLILWMEGILKISISHHKILWMEGILKISISHRKILWIEGYSRSQYRTTRFCEWRDTQDRNITPQDLVNGGILKIAISRHKILWMEGILKISISHHKIFKVSLAIFQHKAWQG